MSLLFFICVTYHTDRAGIGRVVKVTIAAARKKAASVDWTQQNTNTREADMDTVKQKQKQKYHDIIYQA